MKFEFLNLDNIDSSEYLLYKVTSGSHAYGTNVPTSDVDIRGIYWVPVDEYLRLDLNQDDEKRLIQVDDEKHNNVYYSVRRFLELAKTANPNIIELLWVADDCIRFKHPLMDILLSNRDKFITKQAYVTHLEYAKKQIGKAKGANKRVNNPQPVERPSREDFCYVIDFGTNYDHKNAIIDDYFHAKECEMDDEETTIKTLIESNIYPFRPVKLSNLDREIDLSKCHVASLEHVPNTYRLYDYGYDSNYVRGVFQNNALVCQTIPKEDEWRRFIGLLIYSENDYDKAVREWEQYWTWMKERNQARWVDQEKGLLNYDQKNMMHCVRLLYCVENIFTNGEPIIRFTGDKLKDLMEIRRGEWTYEKIMERVEKISENTKCLFEKSTLPEKANDKEVNDIFMSMMSTH